MTTDKVEALPPLSGSLSRRDLLRHFIAGNVLGDVCFYDQLDVEAVKAAQREPAGLGKAIVAICADINEGMPDHDKQLGTDFYFRTPDEDNKEDPGDLLEKTFGMSPTLLPLTAEDAQYLIDNLPALFLDETTEEV